MTMRLAGRWPWWLVVAVLLATAVQAQAARRLGAGRPVGQQSQNVAQRQAQPAQGATKSVAPGGASTAPVGTPNPGTGAGPQSAKSTPPPNAPAPATPAPTRPWSGMLGGLAAGLGLAWLAHSLGLGGAMAGLLPLLLMALVALAGFAWWRARVARPDGGGALAFERTGKGVPSPRGGYKPEHVGNDASARPFERHSMLFEPSAPAPLARGGMIGSALRAPPGGWNIPDGFDVEGFVRNAKGHFVTLQGAWDRGDLATLRSMMTDSMLHEVQSQLAERTLLVTSTGGGTRIDMLDATLLGIEDQRDQWLASVEFSGLLCEDGSASPVPFCEVWNLARSKQGGDGWLVAGVQPLQ